MEVHAEVDENSVRRTAHRAAMSFGDEVDKVARKKGEDSGGNWATRFFKGMFKVSPTLSRLLPGWFEAFASPISFAAFLAGVAAVAQFAAGFLSSGLMLAIGFGFVGLAAYILKSNEKVKKGWADTVKVIKESMQRAAAPMVEPFVRALAIIRGGVKDIEPLFHSIFAAFAPTIEPLTKGLMGFVTGFLQGIDKAAPAIADIMKAFAAELPDFGKALGQFFVYLGEHKGEIINALKLIFTILQVSLPVIAWMLAELTREFLVTAKTWDVFTHGVYVASMWLKKEVPAAWGAIKDFFVMIWTNISDFFVMIWGNITGFFSSGSSTISSGWNTLWTGVSDFFVMIWDSITGYFSSVWDYIMSIVNQGIENFHAVWDPFWEMFGGLVKASWDFVVSVVTLGINALIFGVSWGVEIIKAGWNAAWIFVSDFFKTVWNGISSFFTMIWNGIVTFFTVSLTNLRDFWLGIWAGIVANSQMVWNQISGTVTGVVNNVVGRVTGAWNLVKDTTSYIWNSVTEAISGAMNRAWAIIVGVGNKVTGFISGLYGDMKSAAKRMVQGIVDGIEETIRWVTEKINKLTQMIRDHLPGSPIRRGPLSGDHGPYQGGRKIGEMIAGGLAAGVPSVKAALEALIAPVAGPDTQLPPQPGNGGNLLGSAGGGITINLKGVWDFTDPGAAKKIVAQLYDAIENYKKEYAR